MGIICSEGGFLGLDNIGVFNRSSVIPGAMQLEQADGTSWMGMYALNMMDIAMEIAMKDEALMKIRPHASSEHFVLIAEALNMQGMWNAEDGFYYDTLSLAGSSPLHLRVHSIVGLTLSLPYPLSKRKSWTSSGISRKGSPGLRIID